MEELYPRKLLMYVRFETLVDFGTVVQNVLLAITRVSFKRVRR